MIGPGRVPGHGLQPFPAIRGPTIVVTPIATSTSIAMAASHPDAPTPLELEILLALGSGPLHGYGIIQDIEGRTRAFGNLRSGTLYLALRRLKQAGRVEPCPAPPDERGGDSRRKFVRITDAGREAARAELLAMHRTVAVGMARDLVDPREGE